MNNSIKPAGLTAQAVAPDIPSLPISATAQPAAPALASAGSLLPPRPHHSGSIQKQLIKRLGAPDKLHKATSFSAADLANATLASHAIEDARCAKEDTDAALAAYQALLDPAHAADPGLGARKDAQEKAVLDCAHFEFDCLTTLAQAVYRLKQSDQLKLANVREIVTRAVGQEPALQPVLEQREQHALKFAAARDVDRDCIEQIYLRRSAQVIAQLEQLHIQADLPPRLAAIAA